MTSGVSRRVTHGELKGMNKIEAVEQMPEDYRTALFKIIAALASTEFASVEQHQPWINQAGSAHKGDQRKSCCLAFLEGRLELLQRDPVIEPNDLGVMRFLAVIDQFDFDQPGLDLSWRVKGKVSGLDRNLRNLSRQRYFGSGGGRVASGQQQSQYHHCGEGDKK